MPTFDDWNKLAEENEDALLKDVDWRCRSAFVLTLFPTDDDTTPVESPDDLSQEALNNAQIKIAVSLTIAQFRDKEISFYDPSATALFLDQSHSAFLRAIQSLKSCNVKPGSGTYEIEPLYLLYDYFEYIAASVVFACLAIESYVNGRIPHDFIYSKSTKLGRVTNYSKAEIERSISLEEKLSTVLPQALGVASPENLSLWGAFKDMKDIRNRIVHLKSGDVYPSIPDSPNADSIWQELLDKKQDDYAVIAKRIILHFSQDKSYPDHWIRFSPF
jgi:hypothetical protein